MRTPLRLISTVAVALALAANPALAQPGEVRDNTRVIYSLVPEEGRVQVDARIVVTNERSKGKVKRWGPLHVPAEARDITLEPEKRRLIPVESDALGTIHTLAIKPLVPRERTVVRMRYDLASTPGLPLTTRVEPDYARFCWAGVGRNQGIVRARLPAGWVTDTTGAQVVLRPEVDRLILEKPDESFPGDFYACTDAFQPDSVDRVYILGPSEQLITIDAWGSHLGWKDQVSQIVATDLLELERLIGISLPYPELRIQEVARAMPFDTRTDFRPEVPLLYVDKSVDTPGLATIALARTWFNATTIAEPWLEQGLAMWAGLEAVGLPCPAAGSSPIDPPMGIANWHDPAPSRYAEDRDILTWQGRTACGIIEQVADLIGPEAMTAVTSELLTADTPADGEAWLEAVALQPFDEQLEQPPVDLAAELLNEHGIAQARVPTGSTEPTDPAPSPQA